MDRDLSLNCTWVSVLYKKGSSDYTEVCRFGFRARFSGRHRRAAPGRPPSLARWSWNKLLILPQSALIAAPEETRNAQRMMRNQAINLRISAVHFVRDCNAPVRVALLVVASFCVDGGRSEVSPP